MERIILVMKVMLAAAMISGVAAATTSAEPGTVRDVVLVHGAVMDGSGWRDVYDRLHKKGFRVLVVQLPLTGLDADVAAAREAIARAAGPVVLVGHSYGGAVISIAGSDPKVRSLVYVAAHQPDRGESVADLNARFPLPAHVVPAGEGKIIVDPAHFQADVAADVADVQAGFLADAQRPTAIAAFTTKLPEAAWRSKPSWAIIARQDHTVSPELQRFMYARSKAQVTEIDASHAVYISRAANVAEAIERAATATTAN